MAVPIECFTTVDERQQDIWSAPVSQNESPCCSPATRHEPCLTVTTS
jgi:hypothetical protein